ncbi:MAG: metallophosphoesterase family protein [Candidatus Hodarchaeales archaeon]|jgi:putative phosphoesterase
MEIIFLNMKLISYVFCLGDFSGILRNRAARMTTIAVISDVHANLSAFRAVLTDIHKHKINRIYCLGDLVGYYTEPVPTIHLALARCEVVIKGNHDQAAALGDVPVYYRDVSQPAIEFTTQGLTVNERKILHGLPLMYTLYLDNHKAMMIHGGPEYPLDQYIYPKDEEDISSTFDFMDLIEIDILFLGHTHIPLIRQQDKSIILNPGSVGQPRDGDNRASYVLFDMESFNTKFIRVPYDPTQTIAGIKKHHLSLELADRLLAGK